MRPWVPTNGTGGVSDTQGFRQGLSTLLVRVTIPVVGRLVRGVDKRTIDDTRHRGGHRSQTHVDRHRRLSAFTGWRGARSAGCRSYNLTYEPVTN